MIDPTPEYLDRHYNFMSPEMIGRMLEQLERRSADVRASSRCERDVRYGATDDEKLDLLHPGTRGCPLLVFIHGGYWAFADKCQFAFPAPGLLDAGIGFASVNYALVPHVTIEKQIDQCRGAVAFLYRNAHALGLDPARLCLVGHSAGGHLATMVMTTDWAAWGGLPPTVIKAGMSISGLHDLATIRRVQTLNTVLQLDVERAHALSPVTHAPPAVPLHTAVGGLENEEFQRQTRVLNERWRHVLRRSLVMPGDDHFTVLDRLGDDRSELFAMTLQMTGITTDTR